MLSMLATRWQQRLRQGILRGVWRGIWTPLRQRRHPTPAAGRPLLMADTDVEELLRLARASFVQVQAAWDNADLQLLGALATAPLLEDLRRQLTLRGPGANQTQVVQLEARLLALEDVREALLASVEFSGLIREHIGDVAAPFRELWLLANVKAADRGWQLARVQSLS